MALGRVALGIEDATEVGGGENAFGGFEAVVAQEGVDAAGDPFGFEDVGVLQQGVVAEVQHEAEVVQDGDQLVLVLFFGDVCAGRRC